LAPNTALLIPPEYRRPLSDDQEGNGSGAGLTSGARTRTPAPVGGGGLDPASMAGSGGGGIRAGFARRSRGSVAGRGGAVEVEEQTGAVGFLRQNPGGIRSGK